MATGLYGTKTLASVDFNDVDILYAFTPSREVVGDLQFKPLFGSITENEFRKMIGADGSYKLRLPATIFNKLGFYTLIIKPKTFQTQILDCSVVVTNTDTEIQISKKGIVIPKLNFQDTGSLIGYRVEYIDENGIKVKNFHRIITSSDLVSVSVNSSSSNSSSTSYVLDQNGSSLFLTVTPDENTLISNVQQPSLGSAGQNIPVSNTFFDPVMIEVEMVDQNLKTLGRILTGNSIRDNLSGRLSYFDEQGNLWRQYSLLTRKNQFGTGELDIKRELNDIDFNQSFDDIQNS